MDKLNNNEFKLSAAEFDHKSVPFIDSPTAKQLLESLNDDQIMFGEKFVYSLGAERANSYLQSLTPEKISLMFELFEEKAKARMAIARWNYVAKSIKWSFFSLAFSMSCGYLFSWLVEDTVYNPYKILKGYVGSKWMNRWFMALFIGSMHNVYDSFRIQEAVRKIRKFCDEWLLGLPKKLPEEKEKKATKKEAKAV